MSHQRALKVGLALAAGVVVAGTAAGVTYAATSTSTKVVYACANRSGTLKLLSKGKCPRGYGKVAINKQGPRGLTGPQGPGAVNLSISTNGTATPVTQRRIPAVGVVVSTFCDTGPAAEVDLDGDPAAVGYGVAGQSQFGGGDATILHLPPNDGPPQTDAVNSGASLISLDEPASGNSTEFRIRSGDWYANLMVYRGRHAFSVQLHLVVSPGHCMVRVIATPAG